METIIRPRAPFDFKATARFLRYTESEVVDVITDDVYRRAIHIGKHLRLLKIISRGTVSRPLLAVTVESKRDVSETDIATAELLARRIFDTEHDLKKFRARVAGDALMSKLEKAHRGLHIARWPSLFEALSISILSQQISTVVAMTLKRRMVQRFGEKLRSAGETFYAFPQAESLRDVRVEELRSLGLTTSKSISIIELAKRVSDGEFEESALNHLENESLIEQLTRLRGIGRWTAEWALMLHFGRAGVFPAGDLALRGFVVKYYNDGREMTEREVRSLAALRWGEWSSYAAVYFLAGMRAGIISLRKP
ncbi:MAG TPA: AlkA N-terminal domain-containing protein [Pyrinomonadaceae bacterium]